MNTSDFQGGIHSFQIGRMELPNFQNFDTTTKKNIQEFGPTYSRSGAPLLILLFTVYDIKGKNSDEIYFRLLFRNEF